MNKNNSLWKLYTEIDKKKGISELIINGPDHVYIERDGELIRLNTEIKEEDILPFCENLASFNNVILTLKIQSLMVCFLMGVG